MIVKISYRNLLIPFFFTFLILTSCQNERKLLNGFAINGTVTETYSDSLFLFEGEQKIDSTKVSKGNFFFKGKVDRPRIASIVAPGIGVTDRFFFLENEEIFVELHVEPKQHKDLQLNWVVIDTIYGTKSAEIEYEFEELWRNFTLSKDSDNALYKKLERIIEGKPGHPIGGKLLSLVTSDSVFPVEKARALYLKLDIKNQNLTEWSALGMKLFPKEKFKVGDKFEHFILPNVDWKLLSTDSLISNKEYTLIDFWASWCTPCRKQFPDFKKVSSETVKGNLFQVIGVALEADEKSWEKAIINDRLPWINLIDTTAFQGKIAEKFNIRFIPRNLLVDQRGKIVGVNLEPDQLRIKLDSLQNQSSEK